MRKRLQSIMENSASKGKRQGSSSLQKNRPVDEDAPKRPRKSRSHQKFNREEGEEEKTMGVNEHRPHASTKPRANYGRN